MSYIETLYRDEKALDKDVKKMTRMLLFLVIQGYRLSLQSVCGPDLFSNYSVNIDTFVYVSSIYVFILYLLLSATLTSVSMSLNLLTTKPQTDFNGYVSQMKYNACI